MSANRVNLPASVHARLLNLARERGEDFQLVLTRYAIERLLYRLSRSPHARRFVLKGAQLLLVWTDHRYRPTRDLDLLGSGDASGQAVEDAFRAICRTAVDEDGLRFDADSVKAADIRDSQEYGGQRITLVAHLGRARIPLQVDVGFGDAITPGAQSMEFPSMLGFAVPRIRAYPIETVVAEKFEAMVDLGMANSRMKDFYDLYALAGRFEFDGAVLSRAVRATFDRRKTALPVGPPIALTDEFATDGQKARQWTAFLRKNELADAPSNLQDVVRALAGFLTPVMQAAAKGEDFRMRWVPPGPWAAVRKGRMRNHAG